MGGSLPWEAPQCHAPAALVRHRLERERLLAAGFRDRINKPVDAEKLIATIRALLRQRVT
jgi:DNA-binding response OmpR family regulator